MSDVYKLVSVPNVALAINEVFTGYENLLDPKFVTLRERYGLDQVVAGIEGEFDRILALRHWIKKTIKIEDANPTVVRFQHAFDILDAALDGGAFHCAHFSIVQMAILNAFGYVCRRLGAGDGRLERGKYHGVNEVWVNELAKWVLIDAKYDLHFEKDGVPLSALEMRNEIIADEAAQVKRVYGPQREHLVKDFPEATETYRWVNWEMNTNSFSTFPNAGSSAAVLYDDDYAKEHVWYRDGKPNWAYEQEFFVRVAHQSWIEWTPNVIKAHPRIEGTQLTVRLQSCTPNFKSYQRSVNGGSWEDCEIINELALVGDTVRIEYRSQNLVGVFGPVHTVQVERL